MIDTRLLQAQMVLKGVTTKDLADAQGWSKSTSYRKVSGQSDFTAPEIQRCVKLLDVDAETASQIFFAQDLS